MREGMTKQDKDLAMAWVRQHLVPTTLPGDSISPYRLKHGLQQDTGVYMHVDKFVALLQEMGYVQKKTGAFRLKMASELRRRFKRGMIMA